MKMTAMRDTDVSKSGAFVVKWRAKEKKERIGRVGMLLNVWMSSQLDATGGRCRVRSDRDRGCAVVLLTSTIDSRDACRGQVQEGNFCGGAGALACLACARSIK